jgi:5-methyltetrahydrofolate--homocysteine methyltransferase
MSANLREILEQKILLIDGGMGTQLQQAGLVPGSCGDAWNLEEPQKILALHRKYAEAGADCLTTNTFSASPLNLDRRGRKNDYDAINRAGAELAREALGSSGFVLGDLGPFGGFLEPLGEHTEAELVENFAAQTRSLLAGGVEAIIIETMTALDEARAALLGAREGGAEFVIVTLAYDKVGDGFKTMMGVDPQATCEALEPLKPDVIGCNCGSGMVIADYVQLVRQFREAIELPLIVQPNAGLPELVNDKVIYREPPEEMAAHVAELVAAGAKMIGGCCGTTPRHIELFREELNKLTKV